MEASYKVIFTGQLNPDIEASLIVENVSTLFKISKEKAEAFISSKKKRVIKSDLSQEMALKYKNKLSSAGLIIDMHLDRKSEEKPPSEEHENTLSPPQTKSRNSETNIENVYAPPKSNLVQQSSSTEKNVIEDLKSQGTWKLLLLTIITLGIYSAHYIKRQSNIINEYIDEGQKISNAFPQFILIVSYVSVLLFIPHFFLAEDHALIIFSNILDKVWNILILIWALTVRTKMHTLLDSVKGYQPWFHWFWTILFQQFYINYKINEMNDSNIE